MFEAVLFDLDGTLTESAEGILNTVEHTLRVTGRPLPDREALKRFIGPPLTASYENACGVTDKGEMDRLIDLYHERYAEKGWKENRVYPLITPILKELKKRGVFLAVVSAKPLPFVNRILDWFSIGRLFDRVRAFGMDDVIESKADLVRSALPEGMDPSRAAMVGDRMYDLDAAREAGVVPVGALYGYGTREELEAHGARFIAEDTRQLARYLLGYVPRGAFVSFEGADGCGKSTQMELAADFLAERGYGVVRTREPGGTPVGEKIRTLLLDRATGGMTGECEAYLFAASRSEHVRRVIRPALEEGKAVLCDRFLDSSVAYQGAGRELGRDTVRLINEKAVDGTLPDMTFLFRADERVARGRIADPDRIESEGEAFARRVNEAFIMEAKEDPGRIALIDADRPVDEVFEDVRKALVERLF